MTGDSEYLIARKRVGELECKALKTTSDLHWPPTGVCEGITEIISYKTYLRQWKRGLVKSWDLPRLMQSVALKTL